MINRILIAVCIVGTIALSVVYQQRLVDVQLDFIELQNKVKDAIRGDVTTELIPPSYSAYNVKVVREKDSTIVEYYDKVELMGAESVVLARRVIFKALMDSLPEKIIIGWADDELKAEFEMEKARKFVNRNHYSKPTRMPKRDIYVK